MREPPSDERTGRAAKSASACKILVCENQVWQGVYP